MRARPRDANRPVRDLLAARAGGDGPSDRCAAGRAQARVVADGVVQLLLYLCASQHDETRAAASRAVANLTQNVDNEPILREARCQEALFQHVASSSSDVKWQCRRALSNLEASRLLWEAGLLGSWGCGSGLSLGSQPPERGSRPLSGPGVDR